MVAVERVAVLGAVAADDEWSDAVAPTPAISERRHHIEQRERVWDTADVRGLDRAEAGTEREVGADARVQLDPHTNPAAARHGLPFCTPGLVRRLLRLVSPTPAPGRYRLLDGTGMGWDIADWKTLMFCIDDLRYRGCEMSTLRVESLAI